MQKPARPGSAITCDEVLSDSVAQPRQAAVPAATAACLLRLEHRPRQLAAAANRAAARCAPSDGQQTRRSAAEFAWKQPGGPSGRRGCNSCGAVTISPWLLEACCDSARDVARLPSAALENRGHEPRGCLCKNVSLHPSRQPWFRRGSRPGQMRCRQAARGDRAGRRSLRAPAGQNCQLLLQRHRRCRVGHGRAARGNATRRPPAPALRKQFWASHGALALEFDPALSVPVRENFDMETAPALEHRPPPDGVRVRARR